jgi:hypothetical protein
MPRYFFHVDDAFGLDEEGRELGNIEEARCEAVKLAGKVICEHADKFWDTGEWTMTVANDAGLTLFSLTFFGTDAAALASPEKKRMGF